MQITRWIALAALLIPLSVLAGCDVGHAIVVDNQSDDSILVRLGGLKAPTASAMNVAFTYVVNVPARTKSAVAEQGFTGDRYDSLEILQVSACAPVAAFYRLDAGALFVVTGNLRVEQHGDFPADGGPLAERTDRCPAPSPSASPSS